MKIGQFKAIFSNKAEQQALHCVRSGKWHLDKSETAKKNKIREHYKKCCIWRGTKQESGYYPPDTGGNKAISSPSLTLVSRPSSPLTDRPLCSTFT